MTLCILGRVLFLVSELPGQRSGQDSTSQHNDKGKPPVHGGTETHHLQYVGADRGTTKDA